MTRPNPATGTSDLAGRLGGVRVGLRRDLDVSRHVFRGEISYIVRDRLTFQSHRFGVGDYEVLIQIDAARNLSDIFAHLVEHNVLTADDEGRFYQFILQLHQQGLLSLPIADDKLLFRRYKARRAALLRQRTLGFLFVQVPLWDPSAFLDRTLHLARPLFTRGFFMIWCLLLFAAASVCVLRAHDLARPLDELLATRNLAGMWLTLILLKTCHEFGHAYACRHFDGHVPEMGAYIIAGTPCAYVDATASWGFSSKWRRIIVALAGMYVELLIASLAVFVWAFSTHGVVRAVAYNIIFLASATTLLFNANPLMRYDGYYIFSDLLEIPNLRARAGKALHEFLKRWIVGVREPRPQASRALHLTLLGYGVASGLYRVSMLLGIAALVAVKLPVLGLALAGLYLATAIYRPLNALIRYLLFSQETAPVRTRAVVVAGLAVIAAPVMVLGIPMRWPVYAPAVAERETEIGIRAAASAFVEWLHVEPGDAVSAGAALAQLGNLDVSQAAAEADANLRAGRLRLAAFEAEEPWKAQRERSTVRSLEETQTRCAALLQGLTLSAPGDGTVIRCLPRTELGRHVKRGDEIAALACGGWMVRCVLDERQLTSARVRVGDRIRFRPRGRPDQTLEAEVCRVEPAGSHAIGELSSAQLGSNGVMVDAHGDAPQPYFELRARITNGDVEALRRGVTGNVKIQSQVAEPLGIHAYRALVRFVNSLQAAS